MLPAHRFDLQRGDEIDGVRARFPGGLHAAELVDDGVARLGRMKSKGATEAHAIAPADQAGLDDVALVHAVQPPPLVDIEAAAAPEIDERDAPGVELLDGE